MADYQTHDYDVLVIGAGGAGLRAAGLPIGVAHPVELLDRSYRDAGLYISS